MWSSLDDRDRDLLDAIAEHARRAIAYVHETGTAWQRHGMTVDAVSKRLEQLGELAKRLSPSALEAVGTVDWRSLKGMREILAHDYEDVDTTIVREVVEERLPPLIEAVERALFVEGA